MMKPLCKKLLSLLVVICVIITLLPGTSAAEGQSPFQDVKEGKWYFDAVKYVYERELMLGVAPGCFAPEDTVTRAMLVTVLWRLNGKPDAGDSSFLDVPKDKWYSAAVAWAEEKQIVRGYNSERFGPEDPLTREQLAAILLRDTVSNGYEIVDGVNLEGYVDADQVHHWAMEGVAWANAAGLIVGTSKTSLSPCDAASRGQVAVILERYCRNVSEDFDLDHVPDWLEDYLGTSTTEADSDQDGINDYTEIYIIRSDPTVPDSDTDTDGDGLSNYEELFVYGTNPVRADSDWDGVADAEEIKVCHTDPLLADTDGDGATDGDELTLGLDPSLGGKIETVLQTLGTDGIDEELLASDNPAVPCVYGRANAVLDRGVALSEAEGKALEENRALVGKGVDLTIAEELNANLTLSFDGLEDSSSCVIMQLDEDSGWNPLETNHTEEAVSAAVSASGTYCVMDLNVLLPLLGVDIEAYYEKILAQSPGVSEPGRAVPAAGGKEACDGADERTDQLSPADAIGGHGNVGNWILLNDLQFVSLDKPLSPTSGDTDHDGISDYDELSEPQEKDLSSLVKRVLCLKGAPRELVEEYFASQGGVSVRCYPYKSNPVLPDTDYDGIDDGEDFIPSGIGSNSFTGTLKTDYATSNVSLSMDYRWFFGDNTKYNEELSVTSSLLASAVYDKSELAIRDALNQNKTSGKSVEDVLNFFGMPNAVRKSIETTDVHKSELAIGHRKVASCGTEKNVVAVVIRGTNMTLDEWSSNFEIGNLSMFDSIPDWKTAEHHAGFDVAAVRMMRMIDAYMAEHHLNESDTVYWITGHSRGAAIANLIGAYYEKSGKTAFTYTFASPNTTLSKNAASSRSIFNILNSDDFVPYLPMEGWGYTRYGRSASLSIAKNYERQWEKLTGIFDYNPDTFGMDKTVDTLTEILSGDPREACYRYTCKDHGDGSEDTITITNYGMTKNSREKAIAKIPQNALPYCRITRYDGFLLSGWNFEQCQTPAYFMQILAAVMSNTISQYRFVVELDMAERYEAAKRRIILSAIGGVEHPHYTESYYVLAKNVRAGDFAE